ncbi:MAG: hypothetical protein ACKV2V_08375 [Blastocatellia bacterium]
MQYTPKGNPIFENLSTTFVRVEALFDELRSQGHNGYVQFNFPQTTGYVYLSKGRILNAIEDSGTELQTGKRLVDQMLRQAAQNRGQISIYALQPEAVTAIAGIAEGELVYSDLTSDFASLGKLIRKISRDGNLHFISLSFPGTPREGGLVYIDGDRVDVFCSLQQGELTGSQALQQLITQSESRVATYSMFRAKSADAPVFDDEDIDDSLNKFQPTEAPDTPPASDPFVASRPQPMPPARPQVVPAVTALPVSAQAPASAHNAGPATGFADTPFFPRVKPDANGTQLTQPKPTHITRPIPIADNDDVLAVGLDPEPEEEPTRVTLRPAPSTNGAQAASPQPPVVSMTPAPVITPAEAKPESDMAELTGLLSQVVAAVERGMTVAGRGSSFPTALRAGLLAVTEQFPFLDPFAAEFEYHDREIVFVGSAHSDEFRKGLTEALRQMVEDLIYSSNGRVRDYIAEELVKIEKEKGPELSKFGLDNLTRLICQN